MKTKTTNSILSLILISLACSLPVGLINPNQSSQTNQPVTDTPIPATVTVAPATLTFTPAATLTASLTPTLTETPGPTATSTFAFPVVTVNQQAHCRYGPAKAHLHAADLYPGDVGTVRGRFQYSKWLYIKFDKLNYFCWVAPSVVDVNGDISTILFAEPRLPGPSVLYNPPQNVQAIRDGKKVTISWDAVKMTKDDDRGYFLELFVCQDGAYLWWTFSYPDQYTTSYTIKDEAGCPAPSGGKLYAVEKHGYTRPVELKWPQP